MLIKSTYDFFYLGKIIHKILDIFGLIIPEITRGEKNAKYNHIFNKACPNALSILLLHQLNKLEQIQKQRKKICQFYQQQFPNFQIPHSKPVSSPQQPFSNFSLIRYPLCVNNRDLIITKTSKNNIYLGKWYDQVVGPKELKLDRVGYRKGSCPVAEDISRKIINLPTNISETDAKKVINVLVLSGVEGLNDVK